MKKYIILLFIVATHSNLNAMFFIRVLGPLHRPVIHSIKIPSRRFCDASLPSWHKNDTARATFMRELHKHQYTIDAFGYSMFTAVLRRYVEDKNFMTIIRSDGYSEKWKRGTSNNELNESYSRIFDHENTTHSYKEKETLNSEDNGQKITYVRVLSKAVPEANE